MSWQPNDQPLFQKVFGRQWLSYRNPLTGNLLHKRNFLQMLKNKTIFSNILYFQKNTEMQKLLKHSRWLLKIVRWAEYDAKDGEN